MAKYQRMAGGGKQSAVDRCFQQLFPQDVNIVRGLGADPHLIFKSARNPPLTTPLTHIRR